MRRIVTSVNNEEFKIIEKFCEENNVSMYKLTKFCLFDCINNMKGQDILIIKNLPEECLNKITKK